MCSLNGDTFFPGVNDETGKVTRISGDLNRLLNSLSVVAPGLGNDSSSSNPLTRDPSGDGRAKGIAIISPFAFPCLASCLQTQGQASCQSRERSPQQCRVVSNLQPAPRHLPRSRIWFQIRHHQDKSCANGRHRLPITCAATFSLWQFANFPDQRPRARDAWTAPRRRRGVRCIRSG
jgi:hypothetical protein